MSRHPEEHLASRAGLAKSRISFTVLSSLWSHTLPRAIRIDAHHEKGGNANTKKIQLRQVRDVKDLIKPCAIVFKE